MNERTPLYPSKPLSKAFCGAPSIISSTKCQNNTSIGLPISDFRVVNVYLLAPPG